MNPSHISSVPAPTPALARRALLIVAAMLVLCGLAFTSTPVAAQSCILTRLDSPVVDAFAPALADDLEDSRWEMSFAWRYGKADRHFVGTDEQEHRRAENSQVENDVHLLDLGLRYRLSRRSSISVGIPYLMAERSGPIRHNGELIGRGVRSNTRGIGDMTVIYSRFLWEPSTRALSNISLGVGIKIPTGENSLHDTRLVADDDGNLVPQVRTADQSVQPGDGGFGLILQASGYQILNEAGTFALYGSGIYIIAPETDSGVYTYRSRPGEQIMSIADQYSARLGFQYAFPPSGWSFGLGARIEGIPVHDLFGSSDGFRRPGYILSAEPAVSWTQGPHTVSLSVPIAVERNRQRSVPDLRNGHHGDASFPDFIVLAGYSIRF